MPGARVARGERVTLRTVEKEDVPFVQRGATNPEIRYPVGNPVMTRARCEELLEDDDSDRFLICLDSEASNASNYASGHAPRADDADPGQLAEENVRRIGSAVVEDMDWKHPEIAYWLVPEVHGEGYGKEAISLVIDYTFRAYDTPAIGAEAYDFNDASRGLLESLGFAEEGRRRKYMFVDGEHRDMIQYGLLRREWREQKES